MAPSSAISTLLDPAECEVHLGQAVYSTPTLSHRSNPFSQTMTLPALHNRVVAPNFGLYQVFIVARCRMLVYVGVTGYHHASQKHITQSSSIDLLPARHCPSCSYMIPRLSSRGLSRNRGKDHSLSYFCAQLSSLALLLQHLSSLPKPTPSLDGGVEH